MAALLGACSVHNIRLAEQLFQFNFADAQFLGRFGAAEGVGQQDGDLKRFQQLDEVAADVAGSDDAHRFVADFAGGPVGAFPPAALAHVLGQRPDAFHARQHQPQGGDGHILGQHRRGGGDVDAALPQGVADKAFDAAAHVGHRFEARRGGQHLGIELGHAPTGQAGIGFRQDGQQLGVGAGSPPGGSMTRAKPRSLSQVAGLIIRW